jgi:hypothetical protein
MISAPEETRIFDDLFGIEAAYKYVLFFNNYFRLGDSYDRMSLLTDEFGKVTSISLKSDVYTMFRLKPLQFNYLINNEYLFYDESSNCYIIQENCFNDNMNFDNIFANYPKLKCFLDSLNIEPIEQIFFNQIHRLRKEKLLPLI